MLCTLWAIFSSCLRNWTWLRCSVTLSFAADNLSLRDFTTGLSCFADKQSVILIRVTWLTFRKLHECAVQALRWNTTTFFPLENNDKLKSALTDSWCAGNVLNNILTFLNVALYLTSFEWTEPQSLEVSFASANWRQSLFLELSTQQPVAVARKTQINDHSDAVTTWNQIEDSHPSQALWFYCCFVCILSSLVPLQQSILGSFWTTPQSWRQLHRLSCRTHLKGHKRPTLIVINMLIIRMHWLQWLGLICTIKKAPILWQRYYFTTLEIINNNRDNIEAKHRWQ